MNIDGSESKAGNESLQGACAVGELRGDIEPSDVGSNQLKAKQGRGGKGRTAKKAEPRKKVLAEPKPWEHFDHIVMNLPASALEFLDVLNGLLCKERWKGNMPRVHCYCFMRSNETQADIMKKAERYLGGSINDPEVYIVRDVAPNKIMLCVSFDLPQAVAFANPEVAVTLEQSSVNASSLKKPRTE